MLEVKTNEDLMWYLKNMVNPPTLVDVFTRPDDEEAIHTYVAFGDYKASMADEVLFSGKASEAINFFASNTINPS